MTFRGPTLSDLELRYPFAPRSRAFFEAIPVEEGLASREVVGQAESRLFNALGRGRYLPHMSELTEFSSFFAAALVASQDGFLTVKFAKREAERSKEFFVREEAKGKPGIVKECFGLDVKGSAQDGRQAYTMAFEGYLAVAAKYELTKAPRWKLASLSLERGIVAMDDNLLNDLFGDCAQGAIAEGVRNLRRGVFPRQLLDTKERVLRYVPVQAPRAGKGYLYVEDLLKHPVSDGRHRLVWLVLAPYLVNVKKLENEEAIEKIRAFVAVAGETQDLKRFVEYNVRRARRNGLLPPTFAKVKAEHPDLYSLLPKEVLDAESKPRGARQQAA